MKTIKNKKKQTKRKRTKEHLKEHDEKFKFLFEKSIDAIFVADAKTRKVVDCNKNAEKLIGRSKAEILSMNADDVHPSDRVKETMDAFKRQAEGKIKYVETEVLTKSRKRIPVEIGTAPFVLKGKSYLMGIFRDITGRKKMEETLRESEEKFSMLFKYAPDAYSIHDKESNFIDVNKSFEKLVGYRKKEVIGKSFLGLKLLPKSGIRKTFSGTIGGVLGKSAGTGEFTLNRKDGSKIIVETRAVPIKIKDETVMLIIERDITEQKRAEEELKSSEERLKILFESAPDAIYLNDLKGNFIDGNKTAEEMIGYKREELIGKSFLKLNLLPPTQIPKVATALAKTVLGRPVGPEEYILNRKDGGQVIVEIRSFPVKIKGKIVVLGIARNITERKRTEEAILEAKNKLQIYFDTAGVIILVLSPDFKILLINQKGCVILGYALNEIIGKDFITNFIPKENTTEVKFLFKKLMTRKVKEVQYFENPILTKNNKKRIIGWYNTLLRDEQGQTQAILSTGGDITDFKQAKGTIKHLKELDKLKDDFLNIATHELKTPLTSIVGLSEIMKEQKSYLNPKHKNYINIIHGEGLKLINITKQVLMVTRFESGRAFIDNVSFNLPNFVSSLVTNLNIIADKKKSKVVTNIEEENIVIRSDKEKISQVIYNLVDNAIKYGSEGQTITIAIHKLKKDWVKIEVKDQGSGIPPELQKKVFAKFAQLEPSLNRSQEGIGLGLYICKLIVRKLGGTIGVESVLGEGSTFYFILPVKNNI